MRILPPNPPDLTDGIDANNHTLLDEIDDPRHSHSLLDEIDGPRANEAGESINLNNSMVFVPVEDLEEEITSGLSVKAKTAYTDWVQFHHLRNWRTDTRVNLELLHFAHFHSLLELADHVVEILSNVLCEDCSEEEKLEIFSAGVRYGHVSLLDVV